MEILFLRVGHPRYEDVFGSLRRDAALLEQMWQDAESRLDEHPAKRWLVAVEHADRALAWCAYEPTTEGGAQIKCTNSYERPDGGRGRGLYELVYRERHRLTSGYDCITYVYPEPLGLHLATGWQITADGWSNEPGVPSHHWYQLRRPATVRRPRSQLGNEDDAE